MAATNDPELTRRKQRQEDFLRGTSKINFDDHIDHCVLSGKTAIVTGGASGIGHGIAQALSSNGCKVAVLDLSGPLEAGTDESNIDSPKLFECDVSSWESLLAAFQEVLIWSGNSLDIVVLSAGVRSHNIKDLILERPAGSTSTPVKPPSSVFDVNLLGTYYSAYLALWYFTNLEAKRDEAEFNWKPQLLFIGSLASYVEQPLSADYCASKHGVRGLWKSVRSHSALFGDCQTNLLAPTFIDNRQGSTKSRGDGALISLTNDVKLGEVSDVVAGALRCLCDRNIEGRALCCVKGEQSSPGSNNFDLCDNLIDFNAGKSVLDSFRNGVVGRLGTQNTTGPQ
uniref:NADP-dependent dehydrogenase M3 n=1 Tax=Phoma sp. (strain ATCC 20986 / MF5453) TaxID=1828523 RepID=MFM3_PHOSM|nr:RecName: Full=NADP-dependent dehydrogenase M3; AltName: Full=Squalestatin S1 biosynthesis cluster protein M3 [Phoma sp. MF5453]AMY15060.1 NADP dependent dehydrogenase [Phoma sp. MF5453]